MKTGYLGKSLAFLTVGAAAIAMNRLQYKTSQDLEDEANSLSNFNGGGGYIGLGDDFLNFSGDTGSFADPIHRGKLYTITLVNASTSAARVALLCPGLLRDAVGLIQTGAFNDFSGNAGLSAAGSPLPVELFNAFIDKFPTLVVGFKVTTANINQFEQDITIYKQSPFKTHDSRIINIAAYASEANPNTTLISVQESFYMDSQTVIQYPVLPSTTVSIGLFFGPSLNIAHALRAKTEKAKQTMARMGMTPGVSSFRGR